MRLEFVLCAFFAHEVPLLLYCLLEHVLTKYSLWKSRKIDLKVPPNELVAKSYKQVLLGHLTGQWIALYFAFDLFTYLGMFQTPFPSPLKFVAYILFNMVCLDTATYWIHRTLHHPRLYARFHKQHHEYKAAIPISSEYFSFVEEVFTGFVPTLLGPLILRQNAWFVCCWIAYRVSESADAHLGYDLPFNIFSLFRPSDRHCWHHSKNDGNYGAFFTFWDRICKTDLTYRRYREEKEKKQLAR